MGKNRLRKRGTDCSSFFFSLVPSTSKLFLFSVVCYVAVVVDSFAVSSITTCREAISSRHIVDPHFRHVFERRWRDSKTASFASSSSPENGRSDACSIDDERMIPFVIERIPNQSSRATESKLYGEIASMCIQAFFNDGSSDRTIPPWRAIQLLYLRSLQQGDLRRRKQRDRDSNIMFVARRVVLATKIKVDAKTKEEADSWQSTPLLLDLSSVYNAKVLPKNEPTANGDAVNDVDLPQDDYVRGEILGFVEVTKKRFGLGRIDGAGGSDLVLGEQEVDEEHDEDTRKRDIIERNVLQTENIRLTTPIIPIRPVLTNLSVKYESRKSGVGSKLLQACEKAVTSEWNLREIVLEVEEDNERALRFYQKRGYKILFEDPTSRRYDATGLWLKQVRCKRYVMRKVLPTKNLVQDAAGEVQSSLTSFGLRALQKLKENVFSSA